MRRRRAFTLIMEVQRRFGEVQGGATASAVTLSIFLSLFPLLLVASAVLGFVASGHSTMAADVVDALGLRGEAATLVTDAIASAERSRRAASIVGLAGLVWSALGVADALRLAVDRAWQAKGRGLRDKPWSLVWIVGIGVLGPVAVAATAAVVTVLPGWAAPLALVGSLATSIGLLWFTFHLLGSVTVGWRPHLPGAVAGGIGFQLLTTVGAWLLPRSVASTSAVYGSIGVTFAVLAWLLLFGRLVVYSSILNVVLYEQRAGTVTVEVEVPRIPGEIALTADRAGAVDDVITSP